MSASPSIVGTTDGSLPRGRRPCRDVARTLAAVVCVVMLAMACGSSDDDTTSDENATSDETATSTSTAAAGDGLSDDEATATETVSGDEAGDVSAEVDPSIEAPEWVEVVGVAESLNVRAGPGAEFDRVAQAAPGDTLRVYGATRGADGGVWFQVEVAGSVTGWVFDEYTNEIARPTPTPLATPTPVGTPTPLPVEGEPTGTALVVVAPDGLNLRSEPGLGGSVLRELDDGDEVFGTGVQRRADGRRWTEVTIEGQTGWVASEFVAPA